MPCSDLTRAQLWQQSCRDEQTRCLMHIVAREGEGVMFII